MNKKSWEYRELISTGLRMLKVELSDEIIMRTLAVIELIDQKGKDVTLSDIVGLKKLAYDEYKPLPTKQVKPYDPFQSSGTTGGLNAYPPYATSIPAPDAGTGSVTVKGDGSIDPENLPFPNP